MLSKVPISKRNASILGVEILLIIQVHVCDIMCHWQLTRPRPAALEHKQLRTHSIQTTPISKESGCGLITRVYTCVLEEVWVDGESVDLLLCCLLHEDARCFGHTLRGRGILLLGAQGR